MTSSDHNSTDTASTEQSIPTLASHPGSGQVELVFILDTICSPAIFRARQQYFGNLLNAVQAHLPHNGRLRLGAIAYRASKRAAKDPHSFEAYTLTDELGDVMNFLKAKRPSEGHNFEAAFEDALEVLYRIGWGRSSRRVVVVVGSRPPHPIVREPYCLGQLACPLQYDWRVLLTGLRSYYRLNLISIVCPLYWPADNLPPYAEEYADSCWREIGYTATLKFNPANFAAVARIITTVS